MSTLQTIYMYHTPPSMLYLIFKDDVQVPYTSVKGLFHLYRQYICIINLRQDFISCLQTICMDHTPPLRLYFNFSDDLHASYTSVKALFYLYRRSTCIIHLRQGIISCLLTMCMHHTPLSRLHFIVKADVQVS